MPLWDEKVVVALPETHRLIGEPVNSWDDLRHERILFSTSDPERASQSRITFCRFALGHSAFPSSPPGVTGANLGKSTMQTLQITVAINDEGKLLLPPGCKIVGDVHLQGVGIRSLPENLSIGGYLDLEGTPNYLVAQRPLGGRLSGSEGQEDLFITQKSVGRD